MPLVFNWAVVFNKRSAFSAAFDGLAN
ncbi:hypothetical protein [Lactiplantibacillus plantarum]